MAVKARETTTEAFGAGVGYGVGIDEGLAVSTGRGMHCEAPAADTNPNGQTAQLDVPDCAAKVLSAHLEQAIAPRAEYQPAPQLVQLAAPYLPAGQLVQPVDPASENVAEAQPVHMVDPDPDE